MTPPETIQCVECGGTCHLLSFLREDESPEPGIILSYRCAECRDRFDMVWEPEE